MNSKISGLSKILLILSSILLFITMFTPIWKIELDAPQYPEGLKIKIYADKIGGDLQIVNGLNHYIGMKKLNPHDFIEFTILIYIIGFFGAFSIAAAIFARKKIVYVLFTMFVLFGILSMIDFWWWEYNYGHNLDPNAAIIVPGMAYQPPLIGFKKLLNFGAYSIPDIGGWLMIASGMLMLIVVLNETKVLDKFRKNKKQTIAAAMVIFAVLTSCGSSDSQPITFNTDNCDYCKMTITDNRFACELVTTKGRAYKFDDLICMMGYKKENKEKVENARMFICDYLKPNSLAPAEQLSFVKSENLPSAMGGNTAAFTNKDSAKSYEFKTAGETITWSSINQ